MAFDSVSLYAVARVKVRFLDGMSPTDPHEAIEAALDLVDLDPYFSRYSDQGHVNLIEFEGTVLGGTVSTERAILSGVRDYVAYDPATPFMEHGLRDALGRILSTPAPALKDLLIVAESNEPSLSLSARQGIVLHPDATPAQRREMLRRLADAYPEPTARWLEEQEGALTARLTAEDLVPVLESDDASLREVAIRTLGRLKSRVTRRPR